MLVVDPSSTCDICLEAFNTADRECFCTPCGHVFCASCLPRLRQPTCPMCRKDFRDSRLVSQTMRKVHVDFTRPDQSTSNGPAGEVVNSVVATRARELESMVADIVLQGRLDIDEVSQLHHEVTIFLREQPHGEHASLRTTHALLDQLRASLIGRITDRNRRQDIEESYETRINYLQRQLKEATRQLRDVSKEHQHPKTVNRTPNRKNEQYRDREAERTHAHDYEYGLHSQRIRIRRPQGTRQPEHTPVMEHFLPPLFIPNPINVWLTTIPQAHFQMEDS
ncbi:hypothetical protein M422DRAFT_66218 [Sphaerobolus stellatus SS14]|nr:hypothetical protein M422DRAFT_66218 [Sphaerobolus stellatus SS14]